MKYKGSIVRRGILAGAIVLTSGSAVSLAAAPAGASNTQMTAVGSFTTFFMMHALFPQLNDINPNPESGSETQVIAPDSQTCSGGLTYSTATQPPNGSGQGKTALAAEETAAATAQGCIDFSRSSSPPAPHSLTLPGGTTESGDPASSHLDYYAYALDGVAPLVGSDAPASVWTAGSDTGSGKGLTLAQVQNIYKCITTNWSELGGANEPIALFWPQSGSGTRAVYTDVLGFDPTNPGSTLGDLCTSTTEPTTGFSLTTGGVTTTAPNEENAEDGIAYQNSLASGCEAAAKVSTGIAAPSSCPAAEAIYIYSAGKFSQQWNDTTDFTSASPNFVDTTLTGNASNTVGNFLAGTLNMATMQNTGGSGQAYVDLTPGGLFNQDTDRGTLAVDGSTVTEVNEWYHNLPSGDTTNPSDSSASIPGVRYVYNAADTVLPGYNGAKMMIGFDNQTGGTTSVLCNGDDATTIVANGFLPLTTGSSAPTGSDASSATCREFGGLAFPGHGAFNHWSTPTFDGRSS